jgi:hypothetical protein
MLYLWLVSLKERQCSVRKLYVLALSDFAYLVGHHIQHVPTPTLFHSNDSRSRLDAGEPRADIARSYGVDATTIGRPEAR